MKNSRLAILPLLFTFIVLMLSCSEEGTYDNHYSLSPESFFEILQMPEVFDGEGGRDTIRIKTNLPWKAVPNETWMTVSPSSGVGSAIVTVTSEKNELPELRAGEIVFGNRLWLDKNSSADEVNDMLGIVSIKQSPTLTFSLSADTLFFTPQSDRKSVSITSNLSWEATTRVYWFTLSKTSGEGDGTLVVEATENTSMEKREGDITFRTQAGMYTLTVVQEGVEPVFEVDPDTLSFTYKSTSAVLTVTSNLSWTVSTDNSWLSLSSTGDMYGPIVSVQATENTTSTSREGAVTFTAGDSTYVVPVIQKGKPDSGSYAFVDLGLPSGLFWATCNVGASSPEEYGDYFAWGETEPKSDYSWSTYKWCNGSFTTLTKYNTNSYFGTFDDKTVLDLEDDAAFVNWGGSWRMPTNVEWYELLNTNNCTWTWTTQSGVNGYKVTSKVNGNAIFLPAAGYRYGTFFDFAGSFGYYWSSTLYNIGDARGLRFGLEYTDYHDMGDYYRSYGQSVRPVCGEGTPAPIFALSSNEISFASSGGSQTLRIISNQSWTVSSDASWLTFSETLGSGNATLSIIAEANNSTSSRSCMVTFKAGGTSYIVNISQEGAAPTFSVTPTSAEFKAEGSSKSLTITSNQSWTASSEASWLTLSETSGSGNATLSITAEANNSTSSRSGTVTFKAGGTSYNVSISQDGAAPTFSVTPTSVSFTSSGGNKTLTVTSNLSWTVSSEETWLSLSRTSGAGNESFTLTAETNASTSNRSGEVKFMAGETVYIVDVAQGGAEEIIYGHAYVDLGLSSGLLWATCNVGANSPEEYGEYFAWGETEPKSTYNWSTYKWCNGSWDTLTKYNINSDCGIVDNQMKLGLNDDAAHVNWGGNWRMPSIDDWKELLEKCIWAWTTLNGVNGYEVTSKTNSNSIFLPAAGDRWDPGLNVEGSHGYYWSSTLYSDYSPSAWILGFESDGAGWNRRCDRYYGFSIRPVCVPL